MQKMPSSPRAPVFRVEGAPIRLRVGDKDRVTAIAASHGTVWAGTERGRLFRYERSTGEISEARGALGGGCAVARIYPDPRTRAALVFLRNADAFHARAAGPLRPRWVARLRGMRCAAAAWVLGGGAGGAGGAVGGRGERQVVLLGTALGSLFALSFDEDNERDDAVEKLWAAPDGECIDGVRVERVAGKFVGIVATRSRLYTFFDADALGALFREKQHVSAVQRAPQGAAAAAAAQRLAATIPLPSELQFMTGDSALASRRFVWAAGAGVTHAQVAVHRRRVPRVAGAAAAPSAVVASVVDKATISWATLKEATGSAAPLSCNLSAFHVLVLYPGSVYAFNQISGALTQRIDVWNPAGDVREDPDSPSPDAPRLLVAPAAGFARDVASDVLWVFSEDGQLARIVAGDGEHREAWQAAQDVGRFDLAMALAPLVARSADGADGHAVATTRHAVLRAQAEHAAAAGDWESAARLFAKTEKPIEEVMLAIVEACGADAHAREGRGALEKEKDSAGSGMSAKKRAEMTRYITEYLVRKLDEIEDNRHTQRILIATVLVQLYAERITGEVDSAKREATRKDFGYFLTDRYADLDVPTALAVLARHDCLKEAKELSRLAKKPRYALESAARRLSVDDAMALLDLARATGDADGIQDAVSTLAQPLVHVDPRRIAEMLAKVSIGSDDDPPAHVDHIQLLSALARTARSATAAEERSAAYESAVGYVQQVLGAAEPLCSAWHELVKYLFSLHAEFGTEGDAAASFAGVLSPLDLRAPHGAALSATLSSVLRACLSGHFRGVCVSVYLVLGLHDAAISLALDVDTGLAERTLAGVKALPRARLRALWRRVAARSARPVAVVARSGGVLHVEDVLSNMESFDTASESVKAAVAAALREHRRVAHAAEEEAKRAIDATGKLRADLARARGWGARQARTRLTCGHASAGAAGLRQCPRCGDDTINSLDRPFEDPQLDLPVLGL